jgi:hypothetical protein
MSEEGGRYTSDSRYDGFSWQPTLQSLELLLQAREILTASPRPMTVRQLYYRLVAALVIPNSARSYQNLVNLLTKARKVDLLDTSKFVDRARSVTKPRGYADLSDYLDVVRESYARKPNDGQPHYVEVWTEKDALSAIIGDVIRPYGAHLVVCKGYPSYTVLVEAGQRFNEELEGRLDSEVHLLYFGDFDPSGEDIFRVISEEMFALVGVDFEITKVALTPELVVEHDLPPIPTKASDSRSFGFRHTHGDAAVELDALPPEILEELVRDAVEEWFDEAAHQEMSAKEATERAKVQRAVDAMREELDRDGA